MSGVFLWRCWRLTNLSGKLFSKNHVMGTVHTNLMQPEGVWWLCLQMLCPTASCCPHCGAGADRLLAESKQCCCHHPHPSLSRTGCSRRSAGPSCEHSAASLQLYQLCLLPAPGLQSPPCCDFLSSVQDYVAAEFNPLLYQHRNASITKVVMPNLGHFHPLLHF